MLGGVTYGGYSDSMVVREAFVLRLSDNLDLAGAAPLLCAGITTYSPLRHWNVGKGQKVGIVGLGGLGHMGVKFAKAKSVDLGGRRIIRSEEHTSELQSLTNIVCRLLLEKKNTKKEYRSGTDQ